MKVWGSWTAPSVNLPVADRWRRPAACSMLEGGVVCGLTRKCEAALTAHLTVSDVE